MFKNDEKLLNLFEETRDYFVAFGDRYRQEIIVILAQNAQMSVKQLSQELKLSRPATSHHIKVLKKAGMLGEHKVGVRTYYYPTLKQAFTKVKELIDSTDGMIE